MALSDLVRKAEKELNKASLRRARRRDWVPCVTAYAGYGSPSAVHVIGRVLMRDPAAAAQEPDEWSQRGYEQFITVQVGNHPVRVTVGECIVEGHSNAGGYVDVLAHDHGLAPGWHTALIEAEGAAPTPAPVLIVGAESKVGIICDIDDTVLVTWLPRAWTAAWNSWVKKTNARRPVVGMAAFLARLRRDHPHAPVFYLSTGAWNTFDALREFFRHHRFPLGPMLLTDWGPTPTGLFRNGQEHKRVQLRNLFIAYPEMKWILIGDDGQHDPLTYGDAAADHPDRILFVAIRNLSREEQLLSHGTLSPLADANEDGHFAIPLIQGATGGQLMRAYDAEIAN